jgi:hypothetical protein
MDLGRRQDSCPAPKTKQTRSQPPREASRGLPSPAGVPAGRQRAMRASPRNRCPAGLDHQPTCSTSGSWQPRRGRAP